MKKALMLLIALTFIVSMVGVLQAADLPKPIDKLAKGTTTVIKSPWSFMIIRRNPLIVLIIRS